MMGGSRGLVVVAVLTAVGFGTGCTAFRRMAGNDTVDLKKAQVKSMSVDLRRSTKTICPRAPVQMAVFAEVVLEGENQAKAVETWEGRGQVNRNDKLDFADFAFHSEQGTFDGQGWFAPNPNLRQSAGKEFEIKSVFRQRPDKFSFTTTYKPDYTCITTGGRGGAAGRAGLGGGSGESGRQGATGSQTGAGGDGSEAGSGSPGAPGSDGATGPAIIAYATIVKTPFYDRLVAIAIEGEAQDFLLVPEGQSVVIHAAGGAGGSGGTGGSGGQGGAGGAGNPGGGGGRGGTGAQGGNGGNGGNGGTIELLYDARFPQLQGQIKLDVSGGPAGHGGDGGSAGRGGTAGSWMSPSSTAGAPPPSPRPGAAGPEGARGASGAPGRPGAEGRARARSGVVADKFSGSPEITAL